MPSRYSVVYIPNPMIGVRGIHEVSVNTFGQTPSHLGSRLTVQTGKVLLAEREERGRIPVLVVDEAHLMSYEQLESIRILTTRAWTRTPRCPACWSARPPSDPP
ncbi:hypothetical protein ACFYZI_36720 [Streptomyces griseorubiginosus]|uniref:hypothetical protein n=1 Tax=Streptomyces griseorubiginosus TaxID=67304 RepID=UPI00369DE3AE